jgi:hypothetical protein
VLQRARTRALGTDIDWIGASVADQAAGLYGAQQRSARAPCGPRAVASGVDAAAASRGLWWSESEFHAMALCMAVCVRVRVTYALALRRAMHASCGGVIRSPAVICVHACAYFLCWRGRASWQLNLMSEMNIDSAAPTQHELTVRA